MRRVGDTRTGKATIMLICLLVATGVGMPALQVQAARQMAPKQPLVLYRADWSQGLAGWMTLGHRGWSVVHGVLTYTGAGNSELLAPFRLPAHGDIGVEAQIEQVSRVKNRQSDRGYGLVVNSSGHLWSGVAGGFFYGDEIDTPQSGLYWDGDAVSGEDVALHDGYDRFQLQRRTDTYSMLENGVSTVHFTIKDAHGSRLGLFSRQYRIRIRSLVVLALPPTNTGTASLGRSTTLPALKALDLASNDVPPAFKRLYGHYYPNSEVARQRNVSVQSLDQLGRILSYDVAYRQPTTFLYNDIYSGVTVYQTTQAAHVDTQYLIDTYRRNRSAPAYMQMVPGVFGEEDDLSAYVFTAYDGSQYDVYDLVFRRGRYRVSLELDFPRASVSQEQSIGLLSQLGHIVDGRLMKSPQYRYTTSSNCTVDQGTLGCATLRP